MHLTEYSIENNKSIIWTFSRDNEKRIINKIKTFEPYFYVLENENITDSLIIKEEKGFIGLKGEKLKKISVRIPKDIMILRNKFSKTWEADISFSIKYQIDKVKKMNKEKLRVCYLDIECAGFSNPSEAEVPVTCITTYDNLKKKYYVFVWRKDLKDKKESKEDTDIYYFNTEEKMLNMFIKFIETSDPDILTGWNVGQFDMLYLTTRCKILNVNINKMSPMNRVHESKYSGAVVKGRIIFDLLLAFRAMSYYTLESYRLDKVGELELGVQKIDIGKDFVGIWENNLDLLIEYNKRDVEICIKLDKKLNIIDFYDEVRRLSKCNFEDVLSKNKIIDCFLLQKCKDKVILPSKRKLKIKNDGFEGAKIFKPNPGVHHNVIVMDLKSLYPSIIISGNFSPETLDVNGDIIIGNGIKFNSNKKGIIPEILKELIIERDNRKKLMEQQKFKSEEYNKYYLQQYALKRILNSFYGVLGFHGFRLFAPEIASSVTFMGREILIFTKEVLEKKGYNVIYGDTDSVFILAKKEELQDLIKEGEYLSKEINNSYEEFTTKRNIKEHIFTIQFEKLYKAILFIEAKKRYIGRLKWKGKEVNSLDVTGFEIVRSDTPKIAKIIQKKVVEMILDNTSKEKVFKYIDEEEEKIRDGTYSLNMIGLPKRITKSPKAYKTPTLHLRGMQYSNQYLDTDIKVGDRPMALYITQVPKEFTFTNIICFMDEKEVPKGFIIDYDKMVEIGRAHV